MFQKKFYPNELKKKKTNLFFRKIILLAENCYRKFASCEERRKISVKFSEETTIFFTTLSLVLIKVFLRKFYMGSFYKASVGKAQPPVGGF